MLNYKHYILTRFNYPEDYDVQYRLNIFENFTLPSLLGQTNKNFTWLISVNSVHKNLFKPFLNKGIDIKLVKENAPCIDFINTQPKVSYLITTRIDNDDALHKDYVDYIYSSFTKNQTERLIDSRAFEITSDKKFLFLDRYSSIGMVSPMVTLIKPINQYPISNSDTIYLKGHHELHFTYKFKDNEFTPYRGWIQNINEQNIFSKSRGYGNPCVDLEDFNLSFENLEKCYIKT